jgi:hypothetical protein
VSIKGSPYRWFRAALERGDLRSVRIAAIELSHISLADATAMLVLMAASGDSAYEPAAVRWIGRLAIERPQMSLEDLAAATTTLVALPDAAAAREQLATLCAHYGMPSITGLTDTA